MTESSNNPSFYNLARMLRSIEPDKLSANMVERVVAELVIASKTDATILEAAEEIMKRD